MYKWKLFFGKPLYKHYHKKEPLSGTPKAVHIQKGVRLMQDMRLLIFKDDSGAIVKKPLLTLMACH
jgi:hypothetical protein